LTEIENRFQIQFMKNLAIPLLAALAACGDKSDADYRAEVVDAMHASIGADLADLVQAARDLQAAAPTHAWSATADAAAIAAMRAAWVRTRVAYEHVEGATAPIFGDLDRTLDERYDGYLDELEPDGDPDPFDDTGVTGMHGIERILFAPEIRPEVIDFESPLPGYRPASYPLTDDDAMAFKNLLVKRLIDDASSLRDQWQPAAIDLPAAYRGLAGLMEEQQEKVDLASTGQEESRYANVTLFDLRNNLEGTRQIYELFRPWIRSKSGGDDPDAAIEAQFASLAQLYASTSDDALPPVPSDWHDDQPTPANLATPFGTLWKTVRDSVDPAGDDSVVSAMDEIATLLGFPELAE
jgi:iron uptake system component EfeO